MSKKNLTTEELMIEYFNRYGVSIKLRAIICLIKKIVDKHKEIEKIVFNELEDVKDEKKLQQLMYNLIEREETLHQYCEQRNIDFLGQVIREVTMQSIKIGAKRIADIINTILMIKEDSEFIKNLFSEINYNTQTSENVQNIIAEITKDLKFNKFLDMFVGRADLAKSIIKNHKKVELIGNDINVNELFFAIINLYIDDELNWKVRCKNSITEYSRYETERYDLIVSEIPLLEKVDIKQFDNMTYEFEYGMPNRYLDYFAIQRILHKLTVFGKAFIVVPNSTLFRVGNDRYIRSSLINQDLIEAVITLPERMYEYTMAQVNILIINKRKEKSRKNIIQFIDASNFYIKENGKYIVTEEHIKNIVELYNNRLEKNNISIFLTNEEMQNYDYSLYIWNKYKNEIQEKSDEEQLKLKDVATVIRGIQISKETYEEAKKEGKTHYYITAGDINQENDKIEVKEESLIQPKSRWIEKCEVKENDLIITMKGTSFKIGIVSNLPKSIISGNLMIIRTEGKYDAYVLKEYLKSPEGNKIIKSIQRGTSISIINPEDLENIPIPNLDKEEQKEIREKIIENQEIYFKAMKELEEKRMLRQKAIYVKMKLGGV